MASQFVRHWTQINWVIAVMIVFLGHWNWWCILADAVINYDSDEGEETSDSSLWEKMDSHLGHKELFSVVNGPTNKGWKYKECPLMTI